MKWKILIFFKKWSYFDLIHKFERFADQSCLEEVIDFPREFFEIIKFNLQKKNFKNKPQIIPHLTRPHKINLKREKKEISNIIKSNPHNNHKTQNLTTNEVPTHCKTHKCTYPIQNQTITHYREASFRSLKILHVSLFAIIV